MICKARAKVEGSVKEKAEKFLRKINAIVPKHLATNKTHLNQCSKLKWLGKRIEVLLFN